MKKLFLSGLLMLLGTGVFAQTSQGNISVGGYVGLYNGSNNNTNSESKATSLTVSPSAGYFIKDGLELGLNTSLRFWSSEYKDDDFGTEDKTNSFGFSIGPYIKKYIPITEKLQFTAAGGFGYENSKTRKPDNDEKLISTTSGFYASAAPGITYFATPKLGFSINFGYIGYTRSTQTDEQAEPKSKTTSDGFNLELSPSSAFIGIRYFINR